MRIYFLLICLVAFSNQALGQMSSIVKRELKCSAKGTTLLFVPGQENTILTIENSVARLEEIFIQTLNSSFLDQPRSGDPLLKITFLRNETLGTVN